MAIQDHILLAAIRLNEFTTNDLIRESRQKPNTVRSWLTKSQQDGLIEVTAVVNPTKRSPPFKRFAVRPAARELALTNAWMLTALARAQYTQNEPHGFVPPPEKPEGLLGESANLLEACLTAFVEVCRARGDDPLTSGPALFGEWQRACAEPAPGSFGDVYGIRREILSRLRVTGRLIEDWERVGVNMPSSVLVRYKTIHAAARDPRAFLIAAGFHQAKLHFEAAARASNQAPCADVAASLSKMLAAHAVADTQASLPSQSASMPLTKERKAPCLRLFYGLNFACRFDMLQTAPHDRLIGLARRPEPSDLALVALFAAQADESVWCISRTADERTIANVARTALSAAAHKCGWRNVALAIAATVQASPGGPAAPHASYWWLIARLAFAINSELMRVDSFSFETRPSQEEELMLLGAFLPATRPKFCNPLRTLIWMSSELYPASTPERPITTHARDVSALSEHAGLSEAMRETLRDLTVHISPSRERNADALIDISAEVPRQFH